jgi:CheY-like chemotaxis protein
MKKKVRPKAQLTAASPDRLILVGEDDIDDEEILEEIFLSIDPSIKLTFINDGQKLVSSLENETTKNLPGLIILDYNMPHLNGAEILKCLQQNDKVKNIPKIIWSTANADGFKNICLQLGACEYLVKPSRFSDLEAMLKQMLSYYELNVNT